MTSERVFVLNVKCSGCAHSITSKLKSIEGVSEVMVDVDGGYIDMDYLNDSVREAAITKLSAMGYPEATEENGLLMQAKSYANCLIGKINK